MKKGLILAIVLVVLALLSAGCSSSSKTATGTISGTPATGNGYVNIMVADTPPTSSTVTSIMVTASSIQVHMASPGETTPPPTTTTAAATITTTSTASTTTTTTSTTTTTTATTTAIATTTAPPSSTAAEQWITIPISGPNPFDLMKLQGVSQLLGSAQLQAGQYTQIRMEVSKIQVALGTGALQDDTLPSGELKFVRPFDVIAGQTVDVKLDFNAQKSVTVTGNGSVIVKPVVTLAISNENSSQITSTSGVVSAVNTQASTISVIPTGQSQPLVLKVTAQSIIILNDNQVAITNLTALPTGSSSTVSYYSNGLNIVRIEITTPQTSTTST